MLSDRCNVIDCCEHASHALVVLRTGFPCVWQAVRSWSYLVRIQSLQTFALAIEHARMWPKKFIGRTGKEIAIDGANVDQPVRCIVNGVNEHQRPCLM